MALTTHLNWWIDGLDHTLNILEFDTERYVNGIIITIIKNHTMKQRPRENILVNCKLNYNYELLLEHNYRIVKHHNEK